MRFLALPIRGCVVLALGASLSCAQGAAGGRALTSPVHSALDENGDGEISLDEIRGAELKLKKLDVNRDGVLNGDELKFTVASRDKAEVPEGLVATILSFDANKDGKVTLEEAPERMHGLIERADANKDGALSKAEIEKSLSSPITGGPLGGQGLGLGARTGAEPQSAGLRGLGVPSNLVEMLAKRVFEQHDINRDGKITSEELTGAMKKNLKRLDTNTDGAVEISELQSIAKIFETKSSGDGEESKDRPLQPRRP